MKNKKVLVIGNCQARVIADILKLGNPNFKILDIIIVHLSVNEEKYQHLKLMDEAEIIITQLIADNYPVKHLRNGYIKEHYNEKSVIIPNIFYSGDSKGLSNLQHLTKTIGPLGDYHFECVYESWDKGYVVASAIKKLQRIEEEYRKLSIDTMSINNLVERELKCDVEISSYIKKKKDRLFYTFNHPVNRVLKELVLNIMEHLSIPVVNNFDYLVDALPEALDKFIPFNLISNSYVFKGLCKNENGEYNRIHTYDAEEFVYEFYNFYNQHLEKNILQSVKSNITHEISLAMTFSLDDFSYANYKRYDRQVDFKQKFENEIDLINVASTQIGHSIYSENKKHFIPSIYDENMPLHGSAKTYLANELNTHHSVVELEDVKTFLPSGSLVQDENIINDSLFMSLLFFHPLFRNDKGTDWKWKVNSNINSLDIELFQGKVAYCYHRFYYQYYHWFFDVLPRVWLLKKSNADYDKILIGYEQRTDFMDFSLNVFGVDTNKIFEPSKNIIHFSNLIYPSSKLEERQNVRPSLGDGIHYKGGWDKEYVREINKLFRRRVNCPSYKSTKRLFIGREDAAHRKAHNYKEVCLLLDKYGFETFEPGQYSFEEQVRYFSEAYIVVGIHGAGLTNLLWCEADNTKVIEIVVDGLDDPGYRYLSDLMGYQYKYLPAQPLGNSKHGIAFDDIIIDVAKLEFILLSYLQEEEYKNEN
jgi:hypothetical protein